MADSIQSLSQSDCNTCIGVQVEFYQSVICVVVLEIFEPVHGASKISCLIKKNKSGINNS